MMIYHTTLLLSVAWALLIFNEKQVYCFVLLSSEQGTFCNGIHCPPRSSCAVSVNVINGNKHSDTRCFNVNGDIVRQEIITVSNGEMCIKNLTTMGEKVNVEQSCRNLSKAEEEQLKNNQKIQAAVQYAIEEKSKLYEEQMHKLVRIIEKKNEDIERALEMQGDEIERAAETTAEQLEARLAEMEKNLEDILE